jgi:hypothetical protein
MTHLLPSLAYTFFVQLYVPLNVKIYSQYAILTGTPHQLLCGPTETGNLEECQRNRVGLCVHFLLEC